MLDCAQATRLITKQLDDRLNLFEKARLKLHLLNCNFCYNFKVQSTKIDEILKMTPEKLAEKFNETYQLEPGIKDKIKNQMPNNK